MIRHPSLLPSLFALLLAARFCYPFLYNPLDNLWSDPGRHWENGAHLFHPQMINAIDPKLYQVWVWLVRLLSADGARRWVVAGCTGLLCAGFPYFWYRALREICGRREALGLSLLLGAHPGFLVIYRYFMIETLALTVTGLALWLTLRAARRGSAAGGAWAAAAWVCAGFTKQTMIPLACMFFLYLLWKLPRRMLLAGVTAGTFALIAAAFTVQSWAAMHMLSPWGDGRMNIIYRKSGSTVYEVHVTDGTGAQWGYGWSSPSFYTNPLEPLGYYSSYRTTLPYRFSLDKRTGGDDFNAAVRAVEARHGWRDVVRESEENAIFFLFQPSWPDSSDNPHDTLAWLNNHLRWIWAPCIALIALGAARGVRMAEARAVITAVTLAIILAMFVQQVGVMEGRYRKPIEPFILVAAWFVLSGIKGQVSGSRRSQARVA